MGDDARLAEIWALMCSLDPPRPISIDELYDIARRAMERVKELEAKVRTLEVMPGPILQQQLDDLRKERDAVEADYQSCLVSIERLTKERDAAQTKAAGLTLACEDFRAKAREARAEADALRARLTKAERHLLRINWASGGNWFAQSLIEIAKDYFEEVSFDAEEFVTREHALAPRRPEAEDARAKSRSWDAGWGPEPDDDTPPSPSPGRCEFEYRSGSHAEYGVPICARCGRGERFHGAGAKEVDGTGGSASPGSDAKPNASEDGPAEAPPKSTPAAKPARGAPYVNPTLANLGDPTPPAPEPAKKEPCRWCNDLGYLAPLLSFKVEGRPTWIAHEARPGNHEHPVLPCPGCKPHAPCPDLVKSIETLGGLGGLAHALQHGCLDPKGGT